MILSFYYEKYWNFEIKLEKHLRRWEGVGVGVEYHSHRKWDTFERIITA